jgi:4a-hydroxytetrahydrobiopterin dehydratase|tara:strand:+ start:85 stop:330 length:246 start_codon:yes stop_codon:yes gene_type:complete
MWKEIDNRLVCEYQFESFIEAFAFLSQLARLAEQHNHHPVIHNNYAWVRLELTTHDEGDVVTAKDRRLASAIDEIMKKGLL